MISGSTSGEDIEIAFDGAKIQRKERSMTHYRHLRFVSLALLVALTAPAAAQTWPTRPLRAFVSFDAGSAVDLVARAVFAQVERQLGQPVAVENRPGGGTIVATTAVANAEPDGYTLLVTSAIFASAPWTTPKLAYDPYRDLTPVAPLANTAHVLVTSPGRGVHTLNDLVSYARAHAGKVNYVTLGPGSVAYLNAERFRLAAKFEATPIPYKGSPEALTDIMMGRVDFYFCPLPPALALIRAGELVPLAVSTSARIPELPDVPTTVEAGFADTEFNLWFGVFVPSRTPSSVVERLNREIAAALDNAEVKDRLSKLMAHPMPMSATQFRDVVHKELTEDAAFFKTVGIKND
jgi:tripartite-type tricarboxylate transporter receptor subunit TctC